MDEGEKGGERNDRAPERTDDAPAGFAIETATKRVWVSPALVAINIGIYVLMVVRGVNPISPDPVDLVRWGANSGPDVVSGQWWRLVASVFLHGGALHLLFNMYVLNDIGRLMEVLLGNVGFLILYLVCGVLASLASVGYNPGVVSVGASGAIFGLFGAFIAFLVRQRAAIPPRVRRHLLRNAVFFVAINVSFGLLMPGIDNAAHIGGLLAGLACGWIVVHPLTPEGYAGRWRRNLGLAMAGGALIAAGAAGLPREAAPGMVDVMRLVREGREQEAMHIIGTMPRRNPRQALKMFDQFVRNAPSESEGYNMRGFAHLMLGNDQAAEADWRKAASLVDGDAARAGSLENIGLIHLRRGEWQRALEHAETVAELAPDSNWNLIFRGIAADRLGRRDVAEESFRKVSGLPSEQLDDLRGYLPRELHEYLKRVPVRI